MRAQERETGLGAVAGDCGRDTARLVACVDATPGAGGLAAAVRDDVLDALAAYERISARALGEAETHLPAMRATFDRAAGVLRDDGPAEPAGRCASEHDDALPAGPCAAGPQVTGRGGISDLVLVAALPAHGDAASGEALATRIEALADGLVRGTRVYAIALAAGPACAPAHAALAACAEACRRTGLAWSGGVAASGGAALERRIHGPRLGFWRRPLSTATDRLIAAMRLACDIAELDTALGGGANPADAADAASTVDATEQGGAADGVIAAPYPFTRMRLRIADLAHRPRHRP